MSKSLLEQIEGLLGIPKGELSSQIDKDGNISETAFDSISAAHESKLTLAKVAGKAEERKMEKRLTLTALEKSISEKYGVEIKEVSEMIEDVLNKEREQIKLNPEDVKKSPAFTEAMAAKNAEIEKYKTDINTMKSDFQGTIIDTNLDRLIPELATKHGFKLPEDEVRREKFSSLIKQDLKTGDLVLKFENGKAVITDKDGNAPVDSNYNPVTFDDRFNQVAGIYLDKDTAQQRQSPDTRDDKSQPPAKFSFQKPSTMREAVAHSFTIKDKAERDAYIGEMTIWEKEGTLS